ncbi:MAG: hypothetical protein QNJ82_13430 [Gammaproteobacteria bacterium]|nr:hypothetical protein [Gammaproteobacteria bacterium]
MRSAHIRIHACLLLSSIPIALALLALGSFAATVASATPPTQPSAEVLGTRIFVHQGEEPTLQQVAFHVPKAGTARLRLVNGATLGAREEDCVDAVVMRLHDDKVAAPPEFSKHTNSIRMPVTLKAEHWISAPIDVPVGNTLLRGELLHTKATNLLTTVSTHIFTTPLLSRERWMWNRRETQP